MTKITFANLAKTDNNDAFAAAVADINLRGVSLQMDIQLYLYGVAARWQETGDVRPAVARINMLIDKKALFKGVRRNALVAWVETQLGFEYNLEGDNAHMFHANKAKATGFNLVELAMQENHWYNLTPEPDPTPVDLNILLLALIKKMDTRAAKHKDGDNINPDTLAGLKALVEQPTSAVDAPDALATLPALEGV